MDFKFDKAYPDEYAYLEDFIARANGQLKKMDKVIFHVSDTMKEVPFSSSRTAEDLERNDRRARVISYLEDKRAAYRREVLETISQETTGTDPKVARWIRQSCSFGLDGFDEQTRRHHSQDIDLPAEKLYKLFSELPSIRQEESIEPRLVPSGDEITESLGRADEIARLVEETKKRRQASQHRRGGHRR